MNKNQTLGRQWLALALVVLAGATAARGEWKIESKDGETSIKFGFLAQVRADAVDTPDGQETAEDL